MPTYEFYCKKCENKFEKIVPLGTKESICPKCKVKAKKMLSVPGVIFKGKGFYKTDLQKRIKEKGSPCESCPIKKECQK